MIAMRITLADDILRSYYAPPMLMPMFTPARHAAAAAMPVAARLRQARVAARAR